MNKEILTLETAQKLARYERTIEYVKREIKSLEAKAKSYRRNRPNLLTISFNNYLLDRYKKILDILEVKNETNTM